MKTKKLLTTVIVVVFGVAVGLTFSIAAVYLYEVLTFKIDLHLSPGPWL